MVEGEMTTEGHLSTHHIKGDALTSKVLAINDNAEFKKLVEKLGQSKLPYTAEAIFKRIDDSTRSITVRNIKIGGFPLPSSGPDFEHILRKVE